MKIKQAFFLSWQLLVHYFVPFIHAMERLFHALLAQENDTTWES